MIKDLKDYIIEKSAVRPLYMPYITAGDPDLSSTVLFAKALIEGGADILEIGIPFSDPTADGPVIEEAMVRAMKRPDFSLDKVFSTAGKISRLNPDIPIVFLTYCNPVLNAYASGGNLPLADARNVSREHYTVSSIQLFLDRCRENGVKGIVIPDLPFDSPEGRIIRELAKENETDIILMITPNTSPSRREAIGKAAQGFIYYVTSMGVTGERKDLSREISKRILEIRHQSGMPVFAGFGISSPEQAAGIATAADGIIVGSFNQRIIAENLNAPDKAAELLRKHAAAFSEALLRSKKQ